MSAQRPQRGQPRLAAAEEIDHGAAQPLLVDEVEHECADAEHELAHCGRHDGENGHHHGVRLLHLEGGLGAAGADRVEGLADLLERAERPVHGLQLALKHGADLGGMSEPDADRRGKQGQQADDEKRQEQGDDDGSSDARDAVLLHPFDDRQDDGGDHPGQHHRHDHGPCRVGAPEQRDDEHADHRHLAPAHPGIVGGVHFRGRLAVALGGRLRARCRLPPGFLLGLRGAVLRLAYLCHRVLRVRKVPLMTRPALAACDQISAQLDAPLMSPKVRSSRARCASGTSSMSFAHRASML